MNISSYDLDLLILSFPPAVKLVMANVPVRSGCRWIMKIMRIMKIKKEENISSFLFYKISVFDIYRKSGDDHCDLVALAKLIDMKAFALHSAGNALNIYCS